MHTFSNVTDTMTCSTALVKTLMAHFIYCFYRNSTPDIQVVRIENVSDFHFERIVWPGHDLIFQAPSEAVLDVYAGILTSACITSIECSRLHCTKDSTQLDAQSDP